jgi:uncharacterized protein YbjT (DUF2867 family)
MKVLVTGATGFVGRTILRQLHEAGHSIRLLARAPRSARAQEATTRWGAEVLSGDILDRASLGSAAASTDAIIHLVGIISEVGASTYENVHTRGTANVVWAAQRAAVKRFVHMSALGTRPNAVSRYHRSKWAAEENVRHSSLAFTIFRPSLIYGPEDQFVNFYAKVIRLSPVVPLLGSPHARFQPVPVQAVASAFAKSVVEPKAVGQTYDLCGAEALTLSGIVDQILGVLRKRRLKLHVPLGVAWWQAVCLEYVFPRLLRKAPPLNRDQLLMLQEDNVGNPQPANEAFGLRPVSLRAGISKYLGSGASGVKHET